MVFFNKCPEKEIISYRILRLALRLLRFRHIKNRWINFFIHLNFINS